MRNRDHNQIAVPVGCEGHTEFLLIDGRYIRWRCTDRNCPDVQRVKQRGAWVFHVFDTRSGKRWTEVEPVRGAA